MLLASSSRWSVLVGLLATSFGCGDETSATSTGGSHTDSQCYPRGEAWALALGEGGATSSSTTVGSTSVNTTASSATGTGGGGDGGDASGAGGVGQGAGSDGGGGAAPGAGGGASDYPPGCPDAQDLPGAWDESTSSDDPESCCYERTTQDFYEEGRPLRVDDHRVVARAEARPARGPWSSSPSSLEDVPPASRSMLAAAWRRDALVEHASVASFAQLTLELMLLGAPADLVRDAQRAGLDEVEHARVSFGVVEALGEPRGPSPMPELARATPRSTARDIVAATLRDGCVNETLAAFGAAERAARCGVPALREVLARIADDETRHAALAFRIVRWALDAGQVDAAFVRGTLLAELDRLVESSNADVGTRDTSSEVLGELSASTEQALVRDVAARLRGLLDGLAPAPSPAAA